MAPEPEKTAFRVHAHAFSIVAMVAGFIAAIVIVAALMFVFYDGQSNIDAAQTALINSVNTSELGR